MFHSDNHVFSNHFEIKDHFVHYYESLLREQATWRQNIDGMAFESLVYQSASWLGRPTDEDEIHHVIRGTAKGKAPGPNDFPIFQVRGL